MAVTCRYTAQALLLGLLADLLYRTASWLANSPDIATLRFIAHWQVMPLHILTLGLLMVVGLMAFAYLTSRMFFHMNQRMAHHSLAVRDAMNQGVRILAYIKVSACLLGWFFMVITVAVMATESFFWQGEIVKWVAQLAIPLALSLLVGLVLEFYRAAPLAVKLF